LYKFAKKPLHLEESMAERMEYFYSAVAASILGQIIFGILPNMNQPYPIFAGIGFYILLCIQMLSRVWRENDYVSTDLYDNEIRDFIDNDSMEIKTIRVEEDLADENIAKDRRRIQNQVDEMQKRRVIAIVLLSCMFLISPIEGLFLSEYGKDETIKVVMYWVSKLLQTTIVSVAMIHALFHTHECGKWPFYIIISIAWAIVCSLSSLPAILNFDGFVENIPAVMLFYSFATGVLLWKAVYFGGLNTRETDKKRTKIRLAVFGVVFLVVWIINFFIN